jgi:hypothetical protein
MIKTADIVQHHYQTPAYRGRSISGTYRMLSLCGAAEVK